MTTKTLLSTPTHITDRYFFRSHSNDKNPSSKKLKTTQSSSSPTKHYQVHSPKLYPNVYKFPSSSNVTTGKNNKRSQSSDSNRYYFSLDSTSSNLHPFVTDTPYSFSRNIDYHHHHSPTRMDTTTSTNGSSSLLKTSKSPTVRFDPISTRPPLKQNIESLKTSVDRLVSSVNKKYPHQPSSSSAAATTTNSMSYDYISQYYGQHSIPSNFNTNRTHTNIMKTVNQSLLDHTYHHDRTRLKKFDHFVRYYLRLYEQQILQHELNYNLIRCFSSSYLHDLRQEHNRENHLRSRQQSYTYEDIQDLSNPSQFEAYRLKTSIQREKTFEQFSSISSSSDYSPIMVQSSTEKPDGDLFYQIMRERFRQVDASIAGRISKASHELDSDVDIKSSSSFWSDDDHIDETISPSKTPNRSRKITRYISTVNRSLLDNPSDLIADFYLSQLNRNMQESVRRIESIARDKAHRYYSRVFIPSNLHRSLSAEHLYRVRKEHLRYNQTFNQSTSFTAEDVADIYKRFVLENYKRKIAIELERRRRSRQDNVYLVSPSKIVQTKEVIMGRARRTLANDGTSEVIQHISSLSPPLIYSTNKKQLKITSDAPDLSERSQQHSQDMIIADHRPLTKIYTKLPLTNQVQVCRAQRIHSDTDQLSMVHIEPSVTLQSPPIEQPQHMTLLITVDQHISRKEEHIPINDSVRTMDVSLPSNNKATEIPGDSGISLNITAHITDQPLVLNVSEMHQTEDQNEPLPEIPNTVITDQIISLEQFTTEIRDKTVHMPIIISEMDWSDEKLESIHEQLPKNLQNAKYTYSTQFAYEHLQMFEDITDLIDRHQHHHQQQQQTKIDRNQLENPIQSTRILALNYPEYPSSHLTFSPTSSIQEMETFLNNFERSLELEHHLPLIEQISISYPTKNRSMPLHFPEELVEQWIVEKNIDTIPSNDHRLQQQVDTTNDLLSQCSPTSDYETDSVDKDNESVSSTTDIIPLTILPSSSSFSHPHATSSSLLTSSTTRNVLLPITSYLNALALDTTTTNEQSTVTKDFLLTLGFGQHSMNLVQTNNQLLRPTWINRFNEQDQRLPLIIQHEIHSIVSSTPAQQTLQFANENQIEHDETALLLYSHRLQHGHEFGENIQGPLQTFFEPSHFQLPLTTEIHQYHANISQDFSFENSLHQLESKIHANELVHPCEQQPEILAYGQTHYIVDNHDELQPIQMKFDQPIYIEHYHIQSLYAFPQPYYAQINHVEILTDNHTTNHQQLIDALFSSNFILTKPIKHENLGSLPQLDQGNNQNSSQQPPPSSSSSIGGKR